MARTFQPPTTADVPRVPVGAGGPGSRLFQRYSPLVRGRSILKNQDGTFTLLDTPSEDQIAASLAVYLGGHVYEVSDEEAAALEAAGFELGIEPHLTWAQATSTWSQVTETWAAV